MSAVAIARHIVRGGQRIRLVRKQPVSSRPDPQTIAIASDHAGFDMKAVTKVLTEAGWIEPDGAGKAAQRKRLDFMPPASHRAATSVQAAVAQW